MFHVEPNPVCGLVPASLSAPVQQVVSVAVHLVLVPYHGAATKIILIFACQLSTEHMGITLQPSGGIGSVCQENIFKVCF